jgi:hypothetical protein
MNAPIVLLTNDHKALVSKHFIFKIVATSWHAYISYFACTERTEHTEQLMQVNKAKLTITFEMLAQYFLHSNSK